MLLAVLVIVSVPVLTAFQIVEPTTPQDEEIPWTKKGPVYPADRFILSYESAHPAHPPIHDLKKIKLLLGQAHGYYVAFRKGVALIELHLSDLPDLGIQRFHHTAIRSINDQIVAYLNSRGLVGVIAAPDPKEIDREGMDLRSPDQKTLTLIIRTGVVGSLRTIAQGERFPEEEKYDHPSHSWIKKNSPVKPRKPGDERPTDLLRKDSLDNYLFQLNRHPGRRVDVTVAPSSVEDQVAIDFIVTEKKPWLAYFQTANTGTEQTKDWRWRLGFVHNQLFDNDDILSLDFITTDFTSPESRVALVSYEAPFVRAERWRWGVFFSAIEFEASDVGKSREGFKGDNTRYGGELFYNLYQSGPFFADAMAGIRKEKIKVKNETVLVEGKEDLLLPYIGFRAERRTATSGFLGKLLYEWTQTSLDEQEATRLGRLNTDTRWQVLRWDFSHAFFLEPLLNRKAWEDPSTPESSTLAHEMFLVFRGQYSFGNRLISQHQSVAGGAYSVRGYPESIVAGDSSVITTLEYRYHLPRALDIEPDPNRTPLFGQSFRWAPQQVYGRPDWDLILRAFTDLGRTFVSDKHVLEKNETLIGLGLGVEFLYKENLSLRADWGYPVSRVRKNTRDEVDPGDSRFHLSLTWMF